MKNTAKLLVTLSSIAVMTAPIAIEFASADDHNEGKKRGRRSGALVGLTLGALTGDAKLAAAGAVAGGVTGGAAGTMQDYQNDRDDYRAETMAAAIASKDSGGQGEAPSGWDSIDSFVGNWSLAVWGHYDNAARKYHFYYAGSSQGTFSGIQRTDYRIEMQMIGADVIVIETWATVGTEDKRIQSYRFTRS